MDNTVGVYVHIPFCERVCPYCDFTVEAAGALPEQEGRHSLAWRRSEEAYVEDLLAELGLRARDFEGFRLNSLYFGGGSPGLFQPESLARVREAVLAAFPTSGETIETTLEVNPSPLECRRLPGFRREAAINRLSVGVQSFDDSLLAALGRSHVGADCDSILDAARMAGFQNVSVDQIFAALHQTPQMLESDLDQLLAHAPQHISIYELVCEPGTPFGREVEQGRREPYPEDRAADLLDRMDSCLEGAGYRRYELTNFARPGFESEHNQRSWRRQPVLGLGVGAHSTDPSNASQPHGARRSNPRIRSQWSRRVRSGELPAPSSEVLGRESAMAEFCFLSLRTQEGLDAHRFASEFGQSPRDCFGAAIDKLVATELLAEAPDGGLRLSARGRRLADTVASEFVTPSI